MEKRGGQYSVKETKELLDLVFVSGIAFKNAKADGSIGLEDAGQLMPVFLAAGPAVTGLDLVPKELGELDEADANEIVLYAGQKLPQLLGDNAKLIRVVNKSLAVAIALVGLVAELRAE